MRLSKLAIAVLKGSRTDLIDKLSEALKVSDKTVYRYIATNDDNLTKAAAIKVIKEETGLQDEQILEDELETEKAA